MKEITEFRIYKKYAGKLFHPNEGRDLGPFQVIKIEKNNPKYEQIGLLTKEIKRKYNDFFFMYWNIKRKYSKKELDTATLLHLKIKTVFEPTGEECGTIYDETAACEICGTNRKQIGPLILKKGTIPQKDIVRTIGGEVIVSERFVNLVKQRELKGLMFNLVKFEKGISNYCQLIANTEVELSSKTITGDDPFERTTGSAVSTYPICGFEMKSEYEVYICPKGDLIGLNLLSEPYVLNSQSIREYDFFTSKQRVGVKRGLLRPEPIYFCSPAFRKMIEEEKLTGFEFEIANIE